VKSGAERSIEALTWASVVIWLGFALLAHLLGYPWLVVMVLSIILLSSAIYQRSQGWHTSLGIWVFGIWMAVFSVLETVSAMIAAITGTNGLPIDLWVYLGVALVSMGVAVIFRMAHLGGQQDQGLNAQEIASDSRTYSTPRRIDDASDGAYTPPVSSRSGRISTRSRTSTSYGQDDQGYDAQVTSSRGRVSQTSRQTGYGTSRTQRTLQNDYGDDAQVTSSRGRVSQTSRRAGYSTSRAPQRVTAQDDDGYEQDQGGYAQSPAAARPNDRRRVQTQRPRASQPASSQLENRVEDIIRRSRERRSTPPDAPDDLPY